MLKMDCWQISPLPASEQANAESVMRKCEARRPRGQDAYKYCSC